MSGAHRLAAAAMARPQSRPSWVVAEVVSVRIGQDPDTGVRVVQAVEVRDGEELMMCDFSDEFATAALAATPLVGQVEGRNVLVMFAAAPTVVCLIQSGERE